VGRVRARSASVAGTCTVTAIVGRLRLLTVSITGSSTVTCVFEKEHGFIAVVHGTATVAAAVVRVRSRSASAASHTLVSAAVVRTRARTGIVHGTSTVTGAVSRVKHLSATIVCSSEVVWETATFFPNPVGSSTVTLSKLTVFGQSTTGQISFQGNDGTITGMQDGSLDDSEGGYISHVGTGLVEV
jgi:hypothetical protein